MEVKAPLAAFQARYQVRRYARTLLEALDQGSGTHTWRDIEAGLADGTFQLWAGDKSAIVTQVQEYPRRKVLCLYLAGGVIGELQQMLPAVLAWAKAHGCAAAFLAGREGWARSFLTKTEGWRATQVILEKDL